MFACRLPWFMYACIGAAVGLLLVAVLFLIVATASAKLTASLPFVSSRKLRCLRATNCMVRPSDMHAFHTLMPCLIFSLASKVTALEPVQLMCAALADTETVISFVSIY